MLKNSKLNPVFFQIEKNKISKTFLSKTSTLIVVKNSKGDSEFFKYLPLSAVYIKKIQSQKKNQDLVFTLDNSNLTTVVVTHYEDKDQFNGLVWARTLLSKYHTQLTPEVCILFDESINQDVVSRSLWMAASAQSFELENFKSKKSTKPIKLKRLKFLNALDPQIHSKLSAQIEGNNLARWLTALPPNKLDAKNYITFLKSYSINEGLAFDFYSEKKLHALNAGAFLAVSQGNKDRDAGIVKIAYKGNPDNKNIDLGLIGKGIIFDTGGNNLKPFQYMLDMHTDMEGSAVALGLLHAIHKNKEKINVELWLAITENRLSSTAYKSQDIITASNGVTIQTIHTDAEGRMVLADTLNLASKSKPKLMLDFATLTGACESALTDKYSGVFTNDENLHPLLIEAGRESGERVWPFPMDNDYLELIDSDVADIKQCSESGGGDHILASKFLEKFVGKNIKWVHTDLSSGFTKSGLGHIPTRVTGFGINFGYKFLEKIKLI